MSDHRFEQSPPARAHWARLLLILPFVSVLWVAFYNSVDPTLFGIPFFYWYQLVCIPASSVVILLVYAAER